MAARTGMPTITKLAKQLCKYIVQFEPIIRVVTSNDPAVLAALAAALSACQVLDAELTAYIPVGD